MINRQAAAQIRSSAVVDLDPGSAPGTRVLTLGSASPRRAALLDQLGVMFTVETVDIDEVSLEDPGQALAVQVGRIASAKFAAFGPGTPTRLLTADTLVGCDGAVMGKPVSDAGLTESLQAMSGRTLTISTGLCLGQRGAVPDLRVVTTVVTLRTLTLAQIDRYVATGVGRDKAGGLALQSNAKQFIDTVDGCWSNVLGLPLCEVTRMLRPHELEIQASCTPELCGSARG